ncbi:hypothetical protein [Streptomyces bohaiensis]|uniref:hypothetical protein n=1 Tax=Streptomyces bohaiensis TaxID=1431344 RepID=UPI003B77CB1A
MRYRQNSIQKTKASTLTLLITLLAAGCTHSNSHSPPNDFCGEDVDQLHTSLFSGNSEVSSSLLRHGDASDGTPGPVQFCTLYEGSAVVAEAGTSLISPDRGIDRTLKAYTAPDPIPATEGTVLPSDQEVRVWPNAAYALIPCEDSVDWDLMIVIATPQREEEQTLSTLIIPYARATLDDWVGRCFDEVPDI